MIFGAIVAGGTGSRMNISNMPKQFLPLGKEKKPIIIHTLEKFLMCKKFDFIYLGVHKDWITTVEDWLKQYGLGGKNILLAPGGTERNLTIMNIISEIEKNHGENDDHIIVTHDAVRPFITFKILNENIKAAQECGACDTVITSLDTIIESKDGNFISKIPERKNLYLGQTPQSFNMKKLKDLYAGLSEEEKSTLTDACGIFSFKNEPVKLVAGDVLNIKITSPENYRIAEVIVLN